MVVTPLRPPTGTGAFLWIVLPSPSWPKPLSPQAQGVDGTAATFAVAADPPTGLARTHPAATAAPTRLTQDHVDISVLPFTSGRSTERVVHRAEAQPGSGC